MTRLKLAELTSGVGALVLGVGLGALCAAWVGPAAGFVTVAGVLVHAFGMWDRHRLESDTLANASFLGTGDAAMTFSSVSAMGNALRLSKGALAARVQSGTCRASGVYSIRGLASQDRARRSDCSRRHAGWRRGMRVRKSRPQREVGTVRCRHDREHGRDPSRHAIPFRLHRSTGYCSTDDKT
jgi:hypothetical protein